MYKINFLLNMSPIIKILVRKSYLRPMSFRCWPMSRTISWFDLPLMLQSLLCSDPSPLSLAKEPPLTVELDDDCSTDPLCCKQPLVGCNMVSSVSKCLFLRGGGTSPPSSESPLEASLAMGRLDLNAFPTSMQIYYWTTTHQI